MKRALLVDTNFSARPLLQALEQRGIETHVMGGRPSDTLARSSDRYIEADYSDPAAIERAAENLAVDYLVPGCNDLSYEACSQANVSLRLTGIDSPDTLNALHRKDAFRQLCSDHDLSSPRRYPSIHAALDAGGPKIVKPADAYSGNGITVVRQPERKALTNAIALAETISRNSSVVIEDFIEGQLYSHSAFLENGGIAVDFLVKEHCFTNPYVVDTSYLTPDFPLSADIRRQVTRLVEVLGLTSGLIHTQFIANDSEVFLIEVTRRCPGDLYGELIRHSTDYDYAAAYTAGYCHAALPHSNDNNENPLRILRHTVTGERRGFLQGWCLNTPAALKAWIPLAVSGEWLEPSPGGRVGVAFVSAESNNHLNALVAMAAHSELISIDYTDD